jgi:hypothetical protein
MVREMAKTAAKRKKPARARKTKPEALPPAPYVATAIPRTSFTLGVDPKKVDQTIQELRKQIGHWTRRGFADKVRISYKGKPIAPDIPVAYFLAAEALTFWTAGILQALIINLGGKTFLTVELVSSAVEHYNTGMERYLAGDMDGAGIHFEKGVDSDPYHPGCHLMLGVALKVKGNWTAAKKHFQRASELDGSGEIGVKAREHLRQMSKRYDEPVTDDAE